MKEIHMTTFKVFVMPITLVMMLSTSTFIVCLTFLIYSMLRSSQLVSGLSSFAEVKRTSLLLCASRRICPAVLESNGLLSYTKGYPNGWSGHVPLKLKSYKSNFNYFVGESEHLCSRAYLVRAF